MHYIPSVAGEKNLHRMKQRMINSVSAKLLLGALLLAAPGRSQAAPPWITKADLFEAGAGGYKLYRIPGMVATANGVILAYCEARKYTGRDWDTIDVLLRRSADGGKTWEAARKIAEVPGPKSRNGVALAFHLGRPNDVMYNSPLAIADRTPGVVHFLFCLNDARCFYMRSDDDGATFGVPAEITGAFDKFRPEYDWHVLATGPGHGIELKNGRLLVPIWLSTGQSGHKPSVTATVFSDDQGKTWQRGDIAIPNSPEWINPNEAVAVQLADGRVMLNARSESTPNRRLVTLSADGATGWSKPRFDDALPDPICMASLVRLSAQPESDKNRLVFANPDNLTRADGKEKPGGSRDRKNLCLKLSYDEGKTWPRHKSLEPGASAYSDLAVLPNGTLLCFYERITSDEPGHKTNVLTIAHFNLEWLTGGADSISRQPAQ
jgi:sialidase-1